MPTNQLSSAEPTTHTLPLFYLRQALKGRKLSPLVVFTSSILQSGMVVYIFKQFKNVSLQYVILPALYQH